MLIGRFLENKKLVQKKQENRENSQKE